MQCELICALVKLICGTSQAVHGPNGPILYMWPRSAGTHGHKGARRDSEQTASWQNLHRERTVAMQVLAHCNRCGIPGRKARR